MRVPVDLEDVKKVLAQLDDRLKKFESGNFDLHGRRISNVGRSESDYDYVARIELSKFDILLQTRADLQKQIDELDKRITALGG